MKTKALFLATRETFQKWLQDRAPNEAAALAYYTLLSVPALILLLQWFLGQVVNQQTQQRAINFIVQAVTGPGQQAITSMIKNADQAGRGGGLATVVSLAMLAFSATGVVVHLEQALNRIWDVPSEGGGFAGKLRERLSSLLVVLFLGLFLLATMFVSTFISGFAQTVTAKLSIGEWMLQGINITVSLLILIVLFGTTFKTIPDAVVEWPDVWPGAAVTAMLFIVGQYVLSLYLGKSAPGSAYGATGSIVAFVVWAYYSALIFFWGAEFTQVYASQIERRIPSV